MRVGLAVLACFVFSVSAVLLLGASFAGPSNADLDSEIASVETQLVASQATAARYRNGSPIRLEADLDVLVLTATKDMLSQKRSSWLRGISLSYVSDGFPLKPADPATIAKLRDDYVAAEHKADSSKSVAQRYNPESLLGVTSQLAYLADHVTASMARQRLVAASLGLMRASASEIGRSKDDRGAL